MKVIIRVIVLLAVATLFLSGCTSAESVMLSSRLRSIGLNQSAQTYDKGAFSFSYERSSLEIVDNIVYYKNYYSEENTFNDNMYTSEPKINIYKKNRMSLEAGITDDLTAQIGYSWHHNNVLDAEIRDSLATQANWNYHGDDNIYEGVDLGLKYRIINEASYILSIYGNIGYFTNDLSYDDNPYKSKNIEIKGGVIGGYRYGDSPYIPSLAVFTSKTLTERERTIPGVKAKKELNDLGVEGNLLLDLGRMRLLAGSGLEYRMGDKLKDVEPYFFGRLSFMFVK